MPRKDIQEQQEIFNNIKIDIYKLQTDVAQLKTEVIKTTAEVVALKLEIKDLRENEMSKLKEDMIRMQEQAKPYAKFFYIILSVIASGIGTAILGLILSGKLS